MTKSPLERGIGLITIDCSQCPYERLLHYPTCYCLFGVVDYSTKCPFDYDLKRARKEYELNKDCIEFYYNFVKNLLVN